MAAIVGPSIDKYQSSRVNVLRLDHIKGRAASVKANNRCILLLRA